MNQPQRAPADKAGARPYGDDPTELFEALLAEHGSALYGLARQLSSSPEEAEDLVQETLIRAWRHPEALDGTSGSARAWIMTVARNLAYDRSRRNGRRVKTGPLGGWGDRSSRAARAEEPQDLASVSFAESVLDQTLVALAFEALSEEHRQVLLHAVWMDRSIADTAAVLGIPKGTVKSRLHYALVALRKALEEIGYTR